MALWLMNGVLAAVCVLVVAGLLMFGGSHVPSTLVTILVALGTSTLAFWFGMSAYRVGGGRNLIRFYADRVEVPAPSKRQPLAFPRTGSKIEISDVVIRYRLGIAAALGSVRRGKLIALRYGDVARKLSTLVLAVESDEAALVADFQRFVAGDPAIGRAGHAAPSPRTTYDDRLDRELAQLD
jgi:hypothetical protein